MCSTILSKVNGLFSSFFFHVAESIAVSLRVDADASTSDTPSIGCRLVVRLGKAYPLVAPRRIEIADWPKVLGHEAAKELRVELQHVIAEARGSEVLNDFFTTSKEFLTTRVPRSSPAISLESSMRVRVEDARLAAQEEAQRHDALEAEEEIRCKKIKEDAFLETLNKELADEKRAFSRQRALSIEHEGNRPRSEDSGGSHDDDSDSDEAPPRGTTSRYLLEYHVLGKLGEGGGGSVVKARNRLDKRLYAVKIINYRKTSKKILREILTLSRLVHPHIVRYYGAWQEFDEGGPSMSTISAFTDEDEAKVSRGSDHSSNSSDSSDSDASGQGFWQARGSPKCSDLQDGSIGDGWDDDEDASRASHYSFSLGDEWSALDAHGASVEDGVKTKAFLYM